MPPTDWKRLAKNHIPGRKWGEIKRIWGVVARDFDASDITDLSEAIDSIVGPDFDQRDNVSVFDFHGRHFAAFQDAAAALLKCAYVLRAVGNCLRGGQPTWASVDAYHFSLIAGRALAAFLGIHFVQIRDSYAVLDVFPDGASANEKARFRRANPGTQEPARLILRNRSTRIDQREIWIILIRTLRVASLSQNNSSDAEKICELGKSFGRSRNDIIYRNPTWIYEDDFRQPTCSVAINDDIHSYIELTNFFFEQRDANFAFASTLTRILLALIADLRDESGIDLLRTSYGRCLTQFPGFNISALDTLFSGMFRREAFGVEL